MTPEFSRPIRLEAIGAAGLACRVRAAPGELHAVATRLGVPEMLALVCRLRLSNAEGGVVIAEGRLNARVMRECVVCLDPFESTISARFRVRFVPAGQESGNEDPESDDELPYAGGVIDIGEAVVEQLALDLDPYPRKPGAEFSGIDDTAPGSAFAGLAARREDKP